MTRLIALLICWLWIFPAHAVEPEEMLGDPALEDRARTISAGIRCLVCQNQSIDDSDAQLAKDLRILVRERLMAGESDADVVRYIVSRYGDFVLLKPPLNRATYILWYGPVVLVVTGVALFIMVVRRRNRAAASPANHAPLSAEEQKRLNNLLGQKEGTDT